MNPQKNEKQNWVTPEIEEYNLAEITQAGDIGNSDYAAAYSYS